MPRVPTVDALEDDPRRVVDALEDESVNPNLRAAISKLYLNDFVRSLARAIYSRERSPLFVYAENTAQRP